MKRLKQCVSLLTAAALCLTSLPLSGLHAVEAKAASVSTVVKLSPGEASTFNDTNGDGLGEFEGWGTSLCWWANRIGYSETLTSQAASLFFSEDGLNMNIGRYNIGGGDDVGEVSTEKVAVNENADFYDLETEGKTPSYAGEKMNIETYSKMADIVFSASDADFGFTKGDKVGSFQKIGWINKLDDEVGSGDNLHYTVNADEAGKYTVKLLLTLEGSNDRDAAIRVNGTDYVVDSDTINKNKIASGTYSGSTCMLFVATFEDVELNAGENTINVAGKSDWALDFVKMAVIPSGKEGVLPETDDYLHAEHIVRSDSAIPGYTTDVTRIDPDKDISEYDSFDRVDEECGYAWNYDWDADKNQINVLKAAIEASGSDFLAEAFSNSPPYFMTESGCSSGNTDSSQDNLREDSVNAFATYMADVIKHWEDNGIIFQSTTAMNEPYTSYWGANSNKQEGCHFDQGTSQSRIIVALNKALKANGITDIVISASDETSIDTAITSYKALSDEAKSIVGRIDTHTYSGSNRSGLKALAESADQNLWMSEVDGAYTGGTNAGEMSAALGLSQRIMTDVNGLGSSAWILWNAIDMHVDSSEEGQAWVEKGSNNDYLTEEAMYSAWMKTDESGYWGLAAANHDTEEILLTKKYYAYGQFSRYIRPGYTIIGATGDTLAAYDSENNRVVVVAMNTTESDQTWSFDLSLFNSVDSSASVQAIRTSGDLETGENWADVSKTDDIVVNAKSKSVSATMKANSITTYIIDGVSYDPENPVEDSLTEISVDASMVTGSNAWNNGTVNVASKVVDGDTSTFFDGVLNGWVEIDLGETMEISAIGYAPRSGYESRCKGALIYGSNDGENYDLLYTITSTPTAGKITQVMASQFESESTQYRYIKYTVPDDGSSCCNLAELKVYGSAVKEATEENVIASFHFDDETDGFQDGNAKAVTGGGSVELTDHDGGKAAKFVKSESDWLKVTAQNGESLLTGYDEITVSFDILPDGNGTSWVYYAAPDDSSLSWGTNGNKEVYLGVLVKNGQIQVERYNNNGSRPTAPSYQLDTSAWQHIDIVYAEDCTVLYVDGERVSKVATDYQLTDILGTDSIFNIGKANWGSGEYATMQLDNFQIVEGTAVYDNDKVSQARKEITESLGDISAVNANLTLPGESSDGLQISWKSSDENVIAADGTVVLPEEEDAKVTLTAQIKDGKTVLATEKYEVSVLAKGASLDKIADSLSLPYSTEAGKEVYGNITLPDTVKKASVTWATDHPEIVDVASHENTDYDSTPAGTVTRPAEDTDVTMTATISLDGSSTTRKFTFTVKAAAKEISESDYTDYFFAYFAGEGYSDGEQLYFASSEDGLNWDDLNNNEPVLTSTMGEEGVRDPFIIRSPEGDKFYMIATDLKIYGGNGWTAAQTAGSQSLMVWESTDLVNWSDQRMVEISADIEAGCTWAPEATYDETTGEYVVYWASKVASDNYAKQRVYYAKTRDFYTFTEPQVYIDYDQSSIDTTMIESNGTYYRFTKNEGGSTNSLGAKTKTIFLEKSDSVLGTFTQIVSDSLNSNQYVEGPTIFKLNDDDADTDTWCLLVDDFGGTGYYPLLTTDLESGEFTSPESGTYKMPSRARHGTPIRVTAEEYAAIQAAYGTPETVNAVTFAGRTPELPETVTYKTGETTVEKAVTWNLDGVSFDGNPYSYVTVTGTVEGSTVAATAKVQILPENVEYMIDCANTDSDTWANVKASTPGLQNQDAADQAKTDDNTWGYVSTVGGDGNDMTIYSGSSTSDPYTGGYWARGGKDISYQVTLPAGEHTVMLGSTGWWSMNRSMEVYYSVNGGEETKLCDFNAVKSSESYAQGKITLEEEAVVTLTVKKAASDDPILSWITVTGVKEEEEPGSSGSTETPGGSGSTGGSTETPGGSGSTGGSTVTPGGSGSTGGSTVDPGDSDSTENTGTVESPKVTLVSKITLKAISKKIAAGKKIQLTARVSPSKASNKALKWTSSNKKYAKVDENGNVTVYKAGAGKTVTITAKATDGSGVKASYKISIKKDAVKSISLKADKTVKAGKSLKVKATVNTTGTSANKTLKWTSSNTKYATVSSKGVVKTTRAGKGKTVKITAAATDGSGKKQTVTIKIK